ncbi:hypothetical protein llap_3695 [Limosa lapponica baueri]|uniref:Uncharacterized protein n=1 Tax=Limosa lapponica baueri TaxID=1758121 RepID=A0A2I0UIV6_LIMLA|nr:hypothetical protein llap_3695 [Limosa lapponica baueri]
MDTILKKGLTEKISQSSEKDLKGNRTEDGTGGGPFSEEPMLIFRFPLIMYYHQQQKLQIVFPLPEDITLILAADRETEAQAKSTSLDEPGSKICKTSMKFKQKAKRTFS